jgi:hypothetical protein
VLLLGLGQLLEQVILALGRFVPWIALSPLPRRTQGRWRLQDQAPGEGHAVVLVAFHRRENPVLPGRLDVCQREKARPGRTLHGSRAVAHFRRYWEVNCATPSLHLPEALPHADAPVVTRKKLPEQRKRR